MSLTRNKRTTPTVRSIHRSVLRNTINGFTLIEVMVSLIIVAVGLLGLAGMHLHGMQGNNGALQRTQASFIASDMATRMRVNKVAMDNNLYAQANFNATCAAQARPDCLNLNCSTAQIAQMDIADFICASENELPNVSNTAITCIDNNVGDANPCSLGSPHRVTLSWAETLNAPNSSSLADSAQLRTISLVVRP